MKEDASRGIAALSSGPKLDLGFKEGQTITINVPVWRVCSRRILCFDSLTCIVNVCYGLIYILFSTYHAVSCLSCFDAVLI